MSVLGLALFARLHVGVGYTRFGSSDSKLRVAGTGGTVSLSVGAFVAPRLAIMIEGFDDLAIAPKVEDTEATGTTTAKFGTGIVGFGAGATYFWLPRRLYVAGTIAAARLTVDVNGTTTGRSDFGPGVAVKFGRDWPLHGRIAGGVGAQYFLGYLPEQGMPAVHYLAQAFEVCGAITFE